MDIQIIERLISRSDRIFLDFGRVDYEDCFCLTVKTKENFDVFLIINKLIKSLPSWFKILLYIRNFFARFVGLKTGKLDKSYEFPKGSEIKNGQSLGDFLIVIKEENYLIAELRDKHLDFRFSIKIRDKEGSVEVLLKTVVKLNNFFGRSYFILIKPFHRLIVPNILKKLSNEILVPRF